jgi:hypothetical protein
LSSCGKVQTTSEQISILRQEAEVGKEVSGLQHQLAGSAEQIISQVQAMGLEESGPQWAAEKEVDRHQLLDQLFPAAPTPELASPVRPPPKT